jgi:pimeloyl-ACP methyl ester carboxylesterase
MRGNGHSSYNNKIKKFDVLVVDMRLFVDKLNLKKYVLIRTCLGGFVSHLMAINNHKIEALIFIGALLHHGGVHMFADYYPKNLEDTKNTTHFKYANPAMENRDWDKFKHVLESFHAKTWVTSYKFNELLEDMYLCKILKEVFYGEAIANTSSRNNGKVDGTGEVNKITVRTLVIHGGKDVSVPFKHAIDFCVTVKSSKLVILKECAHFTWYHNLSGTVNPIVEFLK